MRPLEFAFFVLVTGLLVTQNVRGLPRKYLLFLAVAGLATALASIWLGQARWQLAPAYGLFAALSLLLLRRSVAHVALRSLGVALGAVLLATSAAASLGLPIFELPPPNGRYFVGSTSLSLVDQTRSNAFFGAPAEARELYVQIWYPGEIAQPPPRRRTFWEELHRGKLDRFTLFSSYLRGIETHSYEDLPLSPVATSHPMIVFSHALGSFAEQNTVLMEHLASHGYIVLGVGHPYVSMRVVRGADEAVYVDLDKLNELDAQLDIVDAELERRVASAASDVERTDLQLQRYERATGFNELMAVWVDDLRFVLDSVTAGNAADPRLQSFASAIDTDRIGLIGMSFGGAAVTELCKSDARCRAGMNMDGGSTFGRGQREPLKVPFLALVQERSDSLDYLLAASRSDFYLAKVKGATHLDFTDDTVALPILKWLNITGDVDGKRMLEITNVVALQFFDAYLRDTPKPRFTELPELVVRTNVTSPE